MGKAKKKRMASACRKSPTWLKTVIIAKGKKPTRVSGSFGAASPCVRIDPLTNLTREQDNG